MPDIKRKTDVSKLISIYNELKSVWKTGEMLGISGQKAHYLLNKAGINTKKPMEFSSEQIQRIKDYYTNTKESDFSLVSLAEELGKSKENVCRTAKRLGLSDQSRPFSVNHKKSMQVPRWINHPHPRGMLGKKHSEKTKAAARLRGSTMSEAKKDELSQRSIARWHALTPEQKAAINQKQKVSWKSGWRVVGGVRSFYRSRWEANYGRYLEWLRLRGEIESWEHEPETFWFDAIRRGCRSYLPDFRVIERGKVSFHEVKGWMDPRSVTKLSRMAKYHPTVKIVLIQKKQYQAIASVMKPMIPDWE